MFTKGISISLLQRNPPYDFHKEICCVYYKWNCFVPIKKRFSRPLVRALMLSEYGCLLSLFISLTQSFTHSLTHSSVLLTEWILLRENICVHFHWHLCHHSLWIFFSFLMWIMVYGRTATYKLLVVFSLLILVVQFFCFVYGKCFLVEWAYDDKTLLAIPISLLAYSHNPRTMFEWDIPLLRHPRNIHI